MVRTRSHLRAGVFESLSDLAWNFTRDGQQRGDSLAGAAAAQLEKEFLTRTPGRRPPIQKKENRRLAHVLYSSLPSARDKAD